MHYVKLLRPPTIERGRSRQLLKVALAITTDLGDALLSPQEPIELSVIGAYRDDENRLRPVILTQNATPKWRTGMRALKFDLQLPSQHIETIQIRPSNRQLAILGTFDVYPGVNGQGLILGVYADMPSDDSTPATVCFRSLRLESADASAPINVLQIEEDFGDSIARHVWDGGIVLVSLLAHLCDAGTSSPIGKSLPALSGILQNQDRPLNILELGCGVGIAGIAILRILRASLTGVGGAPNILMTDLPEAEERAQANITRCIEQEKGSEKATPDLDFESLDWEDGKKGNFGPKTQAQSWDLVVVSECTYNTDTLLALVKTLTALHSHSAGHATAPRDTKLLLATKPRHSSEREAFDMMSKDGWVASEKVVLPLPFLEAAAQSVEVYLFSRS